MAEFSYAKGRIPDSLQFISAEIKEFENEYLKKSWEEYQKDTKLQKLMDKTIENILTALIEICGTVLSENGVAAENYSEVLSKASEYFKLPKDQEKNLAKLAAQRNRLAHRYLDYKWQAIKMFVEQKEIIMKLLELILQYEKGKAA